MIIVDTSVWVELLRDASKRGRLEGALAGEEVHLTRFTQMELLMGVRREAQWRRLDRYLEVQHYAEADGSTWHQAARTYFDLRRVSKTIRSPIDCCIAEIAIANDALLFHRDRDFPAIAVVRPLRERWIDF